MLRALAVFSVLLLSAPADAEEQRNAGAVNAVRPEAWLFIPEDWRDRVRALASVPLPDGCAIHPGIGLWGAIGATPAGASPRAFLLDCAPNRPAFEAIQAGDLPTMRWLSAETLETFSTMRRRNWGGDVVTIGGAPYALFRYPPALFGIQAGTRGIEGAEDLVLGVAPSGRYALMDRGLEVIDIESGAVVFRRERPTDGRAVAVNVLQERSAGELELVGIRRELDVCFRPYASCASEIVVLDARTRRERALGIVAPRDAVVRRYGSRQVMFDAEPTTPSEDGTFDIVIVDLDSMLSTWRGQPSQAPPPRVGRQCMSMAGVQFAASGSPGEQQHLRVGVDGAGFSVPGAVACAMTGDGSRLALVAPDFIHLYSVDASSSR